MDAVRMLSTELEILLRIRNANGLEKWSNHSDFTCFHKISE